MYAAVCLPDLHKPSNHRPPSFLISKLIINSPWYFFLIAVMGGLLASFWLYRYEKRPQDLPSPVYQLLRLLRFLSVFCISLLLCSLLFKRLETVTENPQLILAIDNSSSLVNSSDSSRVKQFFGQNLEALLRKTSDQLSVKTVFFGSKVRSAENSPTFTDKETDLQQLFEEVENNYANQNTGAMILVSDGIFNKGANPLYTAEKLPYPVYAIALGDTTEIPDIAIQKINTNQLVYKNNQFPVEVVLGSRKVDDANVKITIFKNQEVLATQNLQLGSSRASGTCQFTLQAAESGLVKYTVTCSVFKGEKNISNNSQTFVVEVLDNKEKILILAQTAHPDIACIKESILNNSAYEIEFGFTDRFTKALKPYSLIILHGIQPLNNNFLNQCKNQNIPYWLIQPQSPEGIDGLVLEGFNNRYNDCEVSLNKDFALFGLTNETKQFASILPAVKTFFGNYRLSNSYQSLFTQKIGQVETDNPVLSFTDNNGQKTGLFLGDGLWRWKFRDFAEHRNTKQFDEILIKSIQFLAVKNDKSFFRVMHPKMINENETMSLDAEVYNKSYEPVTEPDVRLELYNADKKKFVYTFGKQNNRYHLDLGQLPFGEYSYQASVVYNRETLSKSGRFEVKEILNEKLNTVANHRLLNQLAIRTGGRVFYPSNADSIPLVLAANALIKPILYSRNTTTSLIDYLPWMILILVLLSAEWYLRKRYLSI
jgi:hypothetical protein